VTKCDAVMSSEGVLENPGLFNRNLHLHQGYYANQVKLTEEYLDMADKYPTWHMKTVRSHVQKMLYRYCVKHLELREMINANVTTEELRACTRYVREVQKREEEEEGPGVDPANEGLVDTESIFEEIGKCAITSVNSAVDEAYTETWYHRHWPAGSHAHAREQGDGCTPSAVIQKQRLLEANSDEILGTTVEGEEEGDAMLANLFG